MFLIQFSRKASLITAPQIQDTNESREITKAPGVMMVTVTSRSVGELFASVLVALLLIPYSPVAAQSSYLRPLGSNLNEVTDYSPQLPFLNLFLASREWLTQCRAEQDPGCSYSNAWDTNEAQLLDLDSSGWIRSLPARSASPIFTMAATFWDVPPEFPAARYVVLYDGSGTIEYGLGALKVTAESSAGRDVIAVNPANGGILLRIASTDPANYIRNIRVVAKAGESLLETETFSPTFLRRLEPYAALRFMDWMRTNGSAVSSWDSRALPTDARYSTEAGVPLEVMVSLANKTGKAPWFNIPHRANDAYVRNFASTALEKLRDDLVVYVEYSNEVWNGAFSQGDWIQARGEATWASSGESGFTKRINWHGKRTAEICDIFRDVFGSAQSRVVCVMASQAANSWTADEALSCPLWDNGPCVSHGINAIAIAPYFGDYVGQEENLARVREWTRSSDGGLGTLFNELLNGGELSGGPAGGALEQSFGWIDDTMNVANGYGVRLLAYEGGQHLVGIGSAGNSEALTNLFTTANRDARMAEVYQRYLNGWNLRGGDLFMHFNDIGSYTRYGSWGALERIGQSSSPKYDELRAYSLGGGSGTRRTLRVGRSSGGTVVNPANGINCGRQCSASLLEGSQVTLRAQATSGFRFVRWSGACSNTQRQCTVTMDRDRSVRAIFRRRR